MNYGELLYADSNFEEQGILDFISFDGVASVNGELDDNDWEAEIYAEDFAKYGIDIGYYLYFDGSEWGGVVEKIEHISSTGIVKLSGVTWRGLLIRKVVVPPSGKTHKEYDPTNNSGAIAVYDENSDFAVKNIMIDLVSVFGGLFVVDQNAADGNRCIATPLKYRYITVFDALIELLTHNYKDDGGNIGAMEMRMDVAYNSRTHKVILTPKDAIDNDSNGISISDYIEFSGDYDMKYTATKATARYNHVIALGEGKGENRIVRHVWLLSNGKTTTNATAAQNDGITAFNEKTMVYEYTSCEDENELVKNARKKLKEHGAQNTIIIDFDPPDTDIPLGDIVSIKDRVIGFGDTRTITRKILRVTADGAVLQYAVE